MSSHPQLIDNSAIGGLCESMKVDKTMNGGGGVGIYVAFNS